MTPSITLVSHTSMLTGVTPKRHGITTDTGRGTVGVVTCFQLAKRAGYLTSMIVGKPRLKRIAKGGTVDHFSVAGFWARDVAGEAVKRLDAQRNGLMFLHFPDPDSLGHQRGWMSKQQLKSVSDCDSAVGKVLAALSQRGLRGSTLTIVTADHGGHGRIHGTADPRDMTIPWIVCGPGIRNGHSLRSPITTCDTAATALYALGVQVPDGWKGKPVLEAFSGQEVGAGASFEMPNAPAKRRIQQP